MRRRLNFTQRKRISQSDVSIRLIDEDAPPLSFEAQVSLDGYDLPPTANVFLEAYRRNSYMRFPWGTVSDTRRVVRRLTLTDIDSSDTVYFRVKVVGSADEDGLIIAQADRIRVNAADQSILPVSVTDLDEIVWRVSFDDDEPFLLVNSRIEGILDLVRSDASFGALVYPAVLRDILERLCPEVTEGGDDQQHWVNTWETFAQSLNAEPIPQSDGPGRDQWIDSTVNLFASSHRLLDRYRSVLNAGA